MKEIETKMIVLSPRSKLTPLKLAVWIYSLKLPIRIKETCYGLLIEGEKKCVQEATEKIRKLAPHEIFSKRRGFPMGDARRCRVSRGGGPRPGFHQLEVEYRLLPHIGEAMEAIEKGEKIIKKKVERERGLSADELKQIVKVNLMSSGRRKNL